MSVPRHLTDVMSLSDEAFSSLLDQSLDYRAAMDQGANLAPNQAGKLAFNLFYENSTRTLLSFEVAAKRLGADVVTVPVAASSIHKGESLGDTVLTLCAQGADFLIMRAREKGAIAAAISAIEQDGFSTAVINGGEGALGHPTQGLLDAATLLYRLGRRASDGLQDQTIAICGDIRHSRVAVSATEAFTRLGASVRLCGPQDLLPEAAPTNPLVTMSDDLDATLEQADVVMALRIQRERLDATLSVDKADYQTAYGIDRKRLAQAAPGALIMHPGPMNRGVELSSELADDPDRSLIRSQVRQGVATRMAALDILSAKKDTT